MSDLTPEMLAKALDRMALINEEAEGATPPMTEPLTHESLAELRRDAESWLMIGGERVLPLLNALDAARAERDALAATVERVRALADWHETKADKARGFRIEINGENRVMDKAAEVHDDAARRLRRALDEGAES